MSGGLVLVSGGEDQCLVVESKCLVVGSWFLEVRSRCLMVWLQLSSVKA